jgi:hypothetical protein
LQGFKNSKLDLILLLNVPYSGAGVSPWRSPIELDEEGKALMGLKPSFICRGLNLLFLPESEKGWLMSRNPL